MKMNISINLCAYETVFEMTRTKELVNIKDLPGKANNLVNLNIL